MNRNDAFEPVSVELYTWIPDPAFGGESGGPPADLGHSAMQAGALYVSFWPELDSLVGRLIHAQHPREKRCPESHAEECDPEGPYMRRPPEFVDRLEGLSLPPMRVRWEGLRESDYDVRTANCSHVALEVLRAGVPPEIAPILDPREAPTPEDDGIWSKIRALLSAPFTDCIPEKLRSLVREMLAAENLKSPAD